MTSDNPSSADVFVKPTAEQDDGHPPQTPAMPPAGNRTPVNPFSQGLAPSSSQGNPPTSSPEPTLENFYQSPGTPLNASQQFNLNRKPEAAAALRHNPSLAPLAANKHTGKNKILIVEDDALISELYSSQLALCGYVVDTALDGRTGEALLQDNDYDLLLLDIMLPAQNGLNILKDIKQDRRLADLPVILLSNLDQGSVIDRALELGAVRYLVKANYTPKDLITVVAEILPLPSSGHSTAGILP